MALLSSRVLECPVGPVLIKLGDEKEEKSWEMAQENAGARPGSAIGQIRPIPIGPNLAHGST